MGISHQSWSVGIFTGQKKRGGGKLTPEPHKKYVSTTEKVDKNKPE